MATLVVYKRRNGWILIEQTYKDNVTFRKAVTKTALNAMGFNKEMSVEQARELAKLLNRTNRADTRLKVVAATRFEQQKLFSKRYLPQGLVMEFERRLSEATFKSAENLKKQQSYWAYTKRLIAEVRIEPIEYADRQNAIYSYFVDKSASHSTVEKVLTMLNRWGVFVCKKNNQFFEKIPNPRGEALEAILDSYQESENFQGPSEPLTPEILENVRTTIKNPLFYNWLWISIWFGLRPAEIDRLRTKPSYHRIEHGENFDILWVYQPKLIKLKKEKRWKGIPIKTEEQKKALGFILKGEHKQPYYQWFEEIFKTYIRPYAGRKGFTDLMLARGEKLENISMWLGHSTIDRTWRDYKDRQKVGS